jgi:mannose-6-phosphate isomerase-like protein (cupin superfamily)
MRAPAGTSRRIVTGVNDLRGNRLRTKNQALSYRHVPRSLATLSRMRAIIAFALWGTTAFTYQGRNDSAHVQPEPARAERVVNAAQGFFFVPPGEGRDGNQADRIHVKVSGADTGGALAVLEVRTAVDTGPSLHVHQVENEWFYALEGEYDIQVGTEIFHLVPGGSVYGPKLVPHTWHDVGQTPGRMLVVVQPAGHVEAFVKDLAKVTPAEIQLPGWEKALFEKHNMELAGPPLPKKHPK